MLESLTAFIPPEIDPWVAGALVVISFFTSALTVAVGIGGGVVLLAIMATWFPPVVLIPVHGLVQLGSNLGRTIVLRHHLLWALAGVFFAGSVIGVIVGANVVTALPTPLLKLILAGFILYAVWGPKLSFEKGSNLMVGGVGALGGFLTMFIGATGPLVAAAVGRASEDRHEVVATAAICMLGHHVLKIIAFGLLGFGFAPYLPLIAAMIASGFLGTLMGRRLLHHLPEARFRQGFNLLLTLLALRLGWAALA